MIRLVVENFQIFYEEGVFLSLKTDGNKQFFWEDLLSFVRDKVADNSESAICKIIIADC